jgi:phenylacetate-CoA ligase
MKSPIWNPSVECVLRGELERLQLERLREVVYKIYNNNYYYRKKMKEAKISPEDIKSLEDIKKLPHTQQKKT